jgi:Cryptococcal mannosyltransferase 1
MSLHAHPSEQFELLPRRSQDSLDDFATDEYENYHPRTYRSRKGLRAQWDWIRTRKLPRELSSILDPVYRCCCSRFSRRLLLRGLRWVMVITPCVVLVLLVFTAVFLPSYTIRPAHYDALQKRCQQSQESGRGNVNDEKIFIASTLHDPEGQLVDGDWGRSIAALVELLGPENVHLSIYENDADPSALAALERLGSIVKCKYQSKAASAVVTVKLIGML